DATVTGVQTCALPISNSVGFYYSDTFLLHRPPAGHPERPDRLRNIVTHLKSCGLWESFEHPTPVAAVAADILSVHTQEHLETIRSEERRVGKERQTRT